MEHAPTAVTIATALELDLALRVPAHGVGNKNRGSILIHHRFVDAAIWRSRG
jgi:hypothetical protein